jgi:predicted GNAT family acetyltransferase
MTSPTPRFKVTPEPDGARIVMLLKGSRVAGSNSSIRKLKQMGPGAIGFMDLSSVPYFSDEPPPTGFVVVNEAFVAEEYRRQGLGRQMYAKALEWAHSAGYRGLASDTDQRTMAAERFWANLDTRQAADWDTWAGDAKTNPVKTPSADWVHPFERADLGNAPFHLVGVTTKKFQAAPDAPVQPGGSCDYCGQAIMYVARVRDSQGKEFNVGLDCAERTGDTKLSEAARRAENKLRREMDKARADALRQDRIDTLQERLGDTLRRLDVQAERRTWGRSIAADMATRLRTGRADDLTPKQYDLLDRIEQEAEEPEPEPEPDVQVDPDPVDSEHVGKVGDRMKLTLIMGKQVDFLTKFGWRRVIKMRDDAGNQFTWFTNTSVRLPGGKQLTSGPDHDWRHYLIEGERFEASGTVKAHSEYEGVKQTELARVKVDKVLQWRDKQGHVLEVRLLGDEGYMDRDAALAYPETRKAWKDKGMSKTKGKGASNKPVRFRAGDVVKVKDPKTIAHTSPRIVYSVTGDHASLVGPGLGTPQSKPFELAVPFDQLVPAELEYRQFAGGRYGGLINDISQRATVEKMSMEEAARHFTRFHRESDPAKEWILLMARRVAASELPFTEWIHESPSLHITDSDALESIAHLEGAAWKAEQLRRGAKLDNGFVLNLEAFKILQGAGLVSADVPLSDLDSSAGVIAGAKGAAYIVMPDGEIVLDAQSVDANTRHPAYSLMRLVASD